MVRIIADRDREIQRQIYFGNLDHRLTSIDLFHYRGLGTEKMCKLW